MKLRLILAMIAALLLGVGLSSARAEGGLAGSGDPFTLTFDELGNGSLDLRNGTVLNNPGTLGPDVSGGSGNLVLTFSLPSPVVTGDVRIWETTLGSGPLSDVLRFTNANGDLSGALNGDRVIVYSDLVETGGETVGEQAGLADTGIPVTLVPRDAGGLLEIGPEGNNGVTYFPGSLADNIYNFKSDVIVPEPSTLVIGSTSALISLGCYWWWRRRRQSSIA